MIACADIEGGAGDDGVGRIDADGNVERFDDGTYGGHDAGDLVDRVDGREAGAGGLAADVEDVGAVLDHGGGAAQGGVDVAVQAVAGEGVGGEVDRTHDVGAFPPGKGVPGEGEGVGPEGHAVLRYGGQRGTSVTTGLRSVPVVSSRARVLPSGSGPG